MWAAGVLLYTLLCGARPSYSLSVSRKMQCPQQLVRHYIQTHGLATAGSFPFWRDEDDAAPQDPASRLRCMALRIVKVRSRWQLQAHKCCAVSQNTTSCRCDA